MNDMNNTASIVILIVGSLSLFLLGVRMLSDALIERGAERRPLGGPGRMEAETGVKAFLRGFAGSGGTGSRPAALLNVLVAVDRGHLPVRRALPALSGINLGMALPIWLVIGAFRVPIVLEVGLAALACALPMRLGLRSRRHSAMEMVVGAGIALFALGYLGNSMPEAHAVWVPSIAAAAAVLIASAAVAWLIGSSLGVHTVVLLLVMQGRLLPALAMGAMLSANLGGALAGAAAGNKLGENARRAGRVQITLNVIAALIGASVIMLPAARGFLEVLAAWKGVGLGVFFVGVQAATALAAGAFANQVIGFADKAAPDGASRPDGAPAGGASRPDGVPGGASRPRAASAIRVDGANESPDSSTLRLVRFDLPDAVESNLALMREGLARMADLSGEMLMVAMNAAQIPEELDTDRGRCETVDRTLEALCTQTSQAVSVAVQSVCTPGQAVRLQQQLHIAVELRNIGTDIKKLLSVLARSRRKGYRPHKASEEELFDITARVLDFLRYNSDFLSGRLEQQDPEVADSMEQAVDTARDRLRKHSRKTMEKKSSADVRGELAFMQAVGYLEHIGDRCLRISQTITELNVRSQ